MGRTRRKAMFDRGAAALAATVPGLPTALYACPICLDAYPEAEIEPGGKLTEEHAPPKSVGGRVVCLTCVRCNNTAGSDLDIHMQRHQSQMQWLGSEDTDRLRITFDVSGEPARGWVRRVGGAILITGIPGIPMRGGPYDSAGMVEHVESIVGAPDADLKFSFVAEERWSEGRRKVGWLRSAYLIAFSALGYRYILGPALAPLREQIARPGDEVIPLPIVFEPSANSEVRAALIIERPSELEGILVQIGQTTVLLPPIEDTASVSFARRIASYMAANPGRTATDVSGKLLPWPHEARFALDI